MRNPVFLIFALLAVVVLTFLVLKREIEIPSLGIQSAAATLTPSPSLVSTEAIVVEATEEMKVPTVESTETLSDFVIGVQTTFAMPIDTPFAFHTPEPTIQFGTPVPTIQFQTPQG